MRTNGKSHNVSVEAKEFPQPTKCLHCDRTFPIAVPIVGQPKDMEYIQLCGQLAQHLMQKHPLMAKKAVEQQMQMGIGLSGLCVLANFVSNDEGLAKWRDLIRHQFHDFSTRNRISDATIEEKVKALDFAPYFDLDSDRSDEIKPAVIALVKDVRDIIEERLPMYPVENVTLVRG